MKKSTTGLLIGSALVVGLSGCASSASPPARWRASAFFCPPCERRAVPPSASPVAEATQMSPNPRPPKGRREETKNLDGWPLPEPPCALPSKKGEPPQGVYPFLHATEVMAKNWLYSTPQSESRGRRRDARARTE